MIASDPSDPFADLIASGMVRSFDGDAHRPTPLLRTLRPQSSEALIELVARANYARRPFFFLGGGTSIAQTPLRFLGPNRQLQPLAISLEQLNRVLEYRPMDFTITVEAGMRISDLRETLALRAQTLTLDTPDSTHSTVGGLLASGRSGPRRRSLGRLRDSLLGAHLVLADGTPMQCGARSLRQARGYDVARLFVGSHGTLGAFSSVTLRTRPLPDARRCAIATLPEGTRERAITSLHTLPIEPTVAALIDGFERKLPGWEGPDGRLFLYFEGGEEAISRATRELRTIFGAIGISETRVFDRDTEILLDQLLDAPRSSNPRESAATLRLYGGTQTAVQIRERVHRLTTEIGVVTEMITDLQNDDVIVRVRASGPRALEISARETFIRLAGEIERAELLEAPQSFRAKFEEAIGVNIEREHMMKHIRGVFDPSELYTLLRPVVEG